MIKDLFHKTGKAINLFLEKVDISQTEKLLELLSKCEGTLVFTGIGKSGLVAKKIAVTMTSCGTRSLFLSPTNALHGDLGIVSENDYFIIFSKSGESDELLNLLPAIRNKHVPVISIVCNEKSRLAKASDFVLAIPMQPELCPYNMAPTTSTVTQMIVGDVLTIGLMKLKNFSLDQYAVNHPAGRIGKRISMRVRDLMIQGKAMPICPPKAKLVDTLVELSEKRCGCVLIADPTQKLLGIFTDGDLRRSLQKKGGDILNSSLEMIMTTKPRTIGAEELVYHALQIMESDQKNAITILPVVDGEKVIGLIRLHDILQSGV